MRYGEFVKRIQEMAVAATPIACFQFSLETIRLLRQSAEAPLQEELTIEEKQLMANLMDGIEALPCDDLAEMLDELNRSMSRDPVSAIEIHPDITQMLCAIENWVGYRRSGDARCIADLAINRVNSVDYDIGGDVGEFSINNMLGSPDMADEFA